MLTGKLTPIAIIAQQVTDKRPSRPTIWRWVRKGVAGAGRLHVKLLSHQNFFEVGFVPGGEQAFVLDADLLGGFVLEQA
jgi:hypothetical protein